MKKLFLSLSCLLFLPIAGCATSNESNALITLNNQLDRVQDVVSTTSSTEVNAVSPYIASPNQENELSMLKSEAYSNMTSEESLRQNVLSLTKKLKNSDTKYKLSRQQSSAINSLTNDLSKYLNYLNNTKNETKKNVSKIQKSSSSRSFNEELTKSSYISLSNIMNERYVYLENIYCSLSQISLILEDSATDDSSICDDCEITQTPAINRFHPNIDTYIKNKDENTYSQNRENEDEASEISQNTDTMQNSQEPVTPINTKNLPPINNFAPNMYGYGNPYQTYYSPINSGRNTDTFYPYMRNIDTYRFSPNYYSGYYGYNYGNIAPQNMAFKENSGENLQNEINEEHEVAPEDIQENEVENEENIIVESPPIQDSNNEIKNDINQKMNFSANNKEDKRQVI